VRTGTRFNKRETALLHIGEVSKWSLLGKLVRAGGSWRRRSIKSRASCKGRIKRRGKASEKAAAHSFAIETQQQRNY